MKKLTIGLMLALVFAVACDNNEAPAEEATAEQPLVEQADEGAAELVEVSAEGTPFEPAVEKASIPEGSWICDMGTVHYARSQEGDGTCPLCNMKLVQYPAAPGAIAQAPADGEHGCGGDCEGCDHKKAEGAADGEHAGCEEGCEGCEKCDHHAKKADGDEAMGCGHDH
ncbi:MAG: hypothetical protein ACNA8W_19165 [Bradymonadaceae bacterium]